MNIWKENSEAAKKERWKALWAMEDLPRPLWFVPASPVLSVFGKFINQKRSVTRLFMDRDYQFERSMKFNRFFSLAQKVWSRDDFVLHLQPQMGVGVFASALGCEVGFLLTRCPGPILPSRREIRPIRSMNSPRPTSVAGFWATSWISPSISTARPNTDSP